jgi:hypothetical protein
MTRISGFVSAVLAVTAAFGLARQALAQDVTERRLHVHKVQVVPHANIPDVSTVLNQGIVAVAYNPPVAGDWPCFGVTPIAPARPKAEW